MKIILIIFTCCLIVFAQAQYDNSSFYFDTGNLDSLDILDEFSENHIGYYDQESVKYKQMVLTKDGISVRFGSEIIIAKKDAIAKGYTFKDKKMFGVAPLNGVNYKEYHDTILALYYQYDNYFSIKQNDFVLPVEEGYLLFFKEGNGKYSLEYLKFEGKKMEVYSMDHTLVMDTLLKIASIYQEQNDGVTTFIASPNKEELSNLVKVNCFDQKREYVLNKQL